jgi:hypothetical protein
VLEVIETVKRVSGVDFKVETAPRRAGDPARIVASSERVRTTLGWQPRFDDLSTIVAHALAWERELMARRVPRGGHVHGQPAVIAPALAIPADGPIRRKVTEIT